MHFSFFLLAPASLVAGAVLRRGDPTLQEIPTTAKPDNTFSNGKSQLTSEAPTVAAVPSEKYGARSIDLPFDRLYHGDMKFFSASQLNSPSGTTDQWTDQPGTVDSADQSACGIPDNAFSISKVAIHPYFLKYADLSRYCMQDVCISFWNGKAQGHGQSDMILKVTDVCSTDPNDPTHCAKPGDIKIDRTKARIMEQLPGDQATKDMKEVNGTQFYDGISTATSETWWFFTKCWADALVQPAYTDNWFAQPPIPNNRDWSQQTGHKQYMNNQASYPKASPPRPTYPSGAYVETYDETTSPPITDWSPSDPEPIWCPVAGGKGWGKPTGNCAGGANQGSSDVNAGGESSSNPATKPSSVVPSAANGASSTSMAGPQSTSTSPTTSTSSTTSIAAAYTGNPSGNGPHVPNSSPSNPPWSGNSTGAHAPGGNSAPESLPKSAPKSAGQIDLGDGEDDICEL